MLRSRAKLFERDCLQARLNRPARSTAEWVRIAAAGSEARHTQRMGVHPPQHPIGTKRDFFLHLFTITCGLLIALSLEALVEWGHHRALVREARENIRRELEDNKQATIKDIADVEQDRLRFVHNLDEERALRDYPSHQHGHSIDSTFSWSSTGDAAWRTARDTGALAYMPYDEVQRYADVYAQQEIANTQAVELFRRQVEAIAPTLMEKDKSFPPRRLTAFFTTPQQSRSICKCSGRLSPNCVTNTLPCSTVSELGSGMSGGLRGRMRLGFRFDRLGLSMQARPVLLACRQRSAV